jgi:vesicle transport through interaction with t-SNAREs protein 1
MLLFSGMATTPADMEAGLFSPTDPLLSHQLQTGGTSIDRSHRMALEAEQMGANVLSDLRKQREQIERANRHLHDADQDLDTSNKILRDMLRRMAANRMLTTIVIALLIIAIFFVIYYKIFH